MGVFEFSIQIKSSTPAAKVFEAIVRASGLISGVLPPVLKSVEVVEHFPCIEANRHGTVKKKVQAQDSKKFTYCYSITEGDALVTTFEKISLDVKITASPNGGSLCKIISKHFANNGVDLTEEKITAVKEKAIAAIQVIANTRG